MIRNKTALVIGCSYNNSPGINQLTGTYNDAKNMMVFLQTNDYNVVMMNDKEYLSSNPLYPSAYNIFNQIRGLLSRASGTTDCIIYYSGHGSHIRANKKRIDTLGGIVASNLSSEADGRDEVIIPVDYNTITGKNLITDNLLNTLLARFGKSGTKIFLVFDCCHSGTMCDLKYTYSYNAIKKKYDTITNNTATLIKSDVIMLSGCKDNEVSYEDAIGFNGGTIEGILTSAFIHCIKNNTALSNDIFLLVQNMNPYTSKYQNPLISANNHILNILNKRSFLNYKNSLVVANKIQGINNYMSLNNKGLINYIC